MTRNEYNHIVYKANLFISDIIYKRNISATLSGDQYDNTIWKLKTADTQISICLLNYKNINPFNEIIIPIKIKQGNNDIFNLVQPFKNDYCIKGFEKDIFNKLKHVLKCMFNKTKNPIAKQMIIFN